MGFTIDLHTGGKVGNHCLIAELFIIRNEIEFNSQDRGLLAKGLVCDFQLQSDLAGVIGREDRSRPALLLSSPA